MVSNSLNMELQELLETLERVQRECGNDPEYQELRRGLPEDWPYNGCRLWRHTPSVGSPSTNGHGRSGTDGLGHSYKGQCITCPC